MNKSIVHTLNKELLSQPFEEELDPTMSLNKYKHIAFTYAFLENSLAVLSDLKEKRSYLYHGGLASSLGIGEKGTAEELDSIWEENILHRIHPDDLLEKYVLEFQFFQFVKALPVAERIDHYLTMNMRMCDEAGEYSNVQHRMFYASSNDSMWLALCLYNFSYQKELVKGCHGAIVNSATGKMIEPNRKKYDGVLSPREKEILQLIAKGRISKDIASSLSISKNTVDRHRQNILEKLHVKNSVEACRIATLIGILEN